MSTVAVRRWSSHCARAAHFPRDPSTSLAKLANRKWDTQNLEPLDVRKSIGGVWRNQLQHCGLHIPAHKAIEWAHVADRKLDLRSARSRQCEADVPFDARLSRIESDIQALERGR